ncbi:tetratricopeptide repeat protein [Tumebacillus lipolyticus]|uniref:Tetratricopeptide repeat protein n=1 Tax=Tumebacillus lipolyticus TaxID=1280370 RepID=A0ABW4ZUZ5_9BACL
MNLMLDQIISTEVSAAIEDLLTGRSQGKTILIENGQPSDLDDAFTAFADRDVILFRSTLTLLDRTIFATIRELLLATKPIWSDWEWVHRDYFREVNAFFPDTYEGKQNVYQISYSWSEIRLNRDILWGFRMMHFASLLLKEVAAHKPLVIALHDVQHADRLTLQTMYHLLHNLKGEQILLVLHKRPYDTEGRQITVDSGAAMEKLFSFLIDALQPLRLIGSKATVAPAAPAKGTDQLPDDHIREIVESLRRGDWDAERIKTSLQNCIYIYNLDNVLTLCDEIFAHLPELAAEEERAMRFLVWRHAGLALAFMEMYPEAIHAFTQMHDYAGSLAERTKAYHLLALCYGKRVGRWDIAKQFLHEGIRITEGHNDFDTVYERCWLYNFLSYVTYLNDRDIPLAMQYANAAYEGIKPFSHMTQGNVMAELEDPKLPLRLFYNLSINISYLHYFAKDYESALDLWQNTVGESVKQIPDIFKKEYFYFEGNILNRLGRLEKALPSYERAYEICMAHSETLSAEVSTRPLGATNFQLKRYAEALQWYQRSLELKIELGDARQQGAYASIILCHLKLGDQAAAQRVFQEAQAQLPTRFQELFATGELAERANEFLDYGPYILIQPYTQMVV